VGEQHPHRWCPPAGQPLRNETPANKLHVVTTNDGQPPPGPPEPGEASGAAHRPGRPRSQERRTAILAAAGELMLEGGLAAATMEAIAARAGVSKATIYKWWPSRGAVALEGFMVAVAGSWSLSDETSTREALYLLLHNAVELFTAGPAGPLLRALTADSLSQPDIARALRERWFGPRRALAVDVVRRGIERKELRPDLDMALTVDALFAPLYYRLLFGHERIDDEFAGRLVEQILTGIASTGISTPPGS
jgi:AcrR family transcriptional regulator